MPASGALPGWNVRTKPLAPCYFGVFPSTLARGVGVAVLGARDAEVEAARSLEQLVEEHVPLVARHHVVEARRALLVPVVVAPGDLGGAALARAAAGVEAVEARRAAEQQRLDQQHRACGAVRL